MLPTLYAIADRATLDARGLTLRAFAEDLLAAGVTLLQYRDKTSAPQTILRAAAELQQIFAGTATTLILNDRADLAALAHTGLHLGQDDLPISAARKLLPQANPSSPEPPSTNLSSRPERSAVERPAFWTDTNVIGLSTHTLPQLTAANQTTADYLALGPIFTTTTKKDAAPTTGLALLRQARALTTKPLVAIGGITLANAAEVLAAGADSLAIISGLFVPGRTVRDVAHDFLTLAPIRNRTV